MEYPGPQGVRIGIAGGEVGGPLGLSDGVGVTATVQGDLALDELAPALPLLPAASRATCTGDAPEMGDIGPASELVCADLERRFAGATLAVEDRWIHSPTAVSVQTTVDGAPVPMRYELIGHRWRLDAGSAAPAGLQARPWAGR